MADCTGLFTGDDLYGFGISLPRNSEIIGANFLLYMFSTALLFNSILCLGCLALGAEGTPAMYQNVNMLEISLLIIYLSVLV